LGLVGPHRKVHAVGSAATSPPAPFPSSSSACLNITSHGHTYDSTLSAPPQAGGYTQHHKKFPHELERWSRKASGGTRQAPAGSDQSGTANAVKKESEEVAIRVFMKVLMEGQTTFSQIGVSMPWFYILCYMLNHVLQNCVEGLSRIDAHIGGDDLHRRCYDILQKKWLAWSGGYKIPLVETTLRGQKIYAAIAGKDLGHPAEEQDAIWHFVFKTRGGKSTKRTFRMEELKLDLIVEYEKYAKADNHRISLTAGHVSD